MEKIHASFILEILGRPAENVKEALDSIITRLGAEKGVEILNKKCHEPRLIEDANDLFTTFAEIELECETLAHYLGLLFSYMPSNVEVIRPEKFSMTNIDLNEIGNRLVHRLHEYDAITKKALVERDIVAQKLKEVAPKAFEQLVKEATPKDQKEAITKNQKEKTPKKKAKKKKSG